MVYQSIYFNFYIHLAILIIYILSYFVWGNLATDFFIEKAMNSSILRNYRRARMLFFWFIQLLAIIINILITILSVELQFFQLSYAFVLFPQIIHNIRWNSIENFNLFYLFGYLSSGLLFQTYLQFYYVQSNFIEFDYLFIILFYCIYLISVLLLYLQYKYGSRCILPKWILNKYYQDCAICLDCIVIADMENQLLQAPVVLTQCKHKFHEKCLRKWLQEKEDCPLCRTKLDEMN
ncbi:unnamed protein product [Paramecium octaurelia]|uniref:RING-type E3 ubiquitin transferase n=1 Tax=Paramecium octaurelia TaxID=43137 RepID=A0A8S1TE18_PAROT|nr:unnamed protein product [Paramecium octaurelia]